jgi:surface antigen
MQKPKRLALVGLLGALVAGGAALAVPADAVTGTRLCHGYDDCRARGYSDHGYEVNGGGSYWNMYVGHNCTNYVAFRLVQGGMSNLRPPADPGQSNARLSAYLWGLVYATRTDSNPKVGSVAWWGSGAAGSIGHVAYVEQVDGDSITVSEDSSSGNDFDWKRITRGQGWPTGFIHFNDGHHADAPLPSGSGGVSVGGGSAPSRAPAGDDMPAAVARGDFGGDVSGGGFGNGAFGSSRSVEDGGAFTGGWDPAPSRTPVTHHKAKAKGKAKGKSKSRAKGKARPVSHSAGVPGSMFGPGGGGWGRM